MLKFSKAAFIEWFQGLPLFKKIVTGTVGFFTASFLLFFIFLYLGLFGAIPNHRDLSNLEELQASRILDSEGELLGKVFEINRTYVSIDTLPKNLLDALVATEDERFYRHNGVDYRALGRVFFKGFLSGQDVGGGSTISQQLIKNTFGRRQRRKSGLIIEKIKEIIAAKRLERIYEKDKILELYLNTVPFGENVYGIEAAAERFFSKHPSELQTIESAVLVGLLKANTSYNPRLHPKASKERRNVVLGQMAKNEIIDSDELEKLQKTPLSIDYNFKSIRNHQPHYIHLVENKVKEILEGKTKRNGKPYDIKNDGLKVYTTVNAKIQTAAEEAVVKHIKVLQKQLEANWGKKRPWGKEPELLKKAIKNSARYKYMTRKGKSKAEIEKAFRTSQSMWIYYADKPRLIRSSPLDSIKHLFMQLKAGVFVTDNTNGDVLAWVGSPSYEFFKYDYVQAKRQVASTFKPIVYASALEQGYKPCAYYRNEKTTYSDYDGWAPENFDKKYGGKYSMAGGLANSVNVVAVDLLYKAKPEKTIELAREFGIESDIPVFPSMALGVADISLVEMVRAYSVFPNDGKLNEMRLITRIEDKSGKVLYRKEKTDSDRAMDDDNARIMVELLKGVIDKGTGRRLRSTYKLENEIGGKTGTAQNYSDGWFIGFTPGITAGVWVGGDQPAVRFRSGKYGQGSHMALPIFGEMMQSINKDTTISDYASGSFPELDDDLVEALDCADFVDETGLEKFFNSLRSKEVTDDKLNRRNRRKKILRSVFEILD